MLATREIALDRLRFRDDCTRYPTASVGRLESAKWSISAICVFLVISFVPQVDRLLCSSHETMRRFYDPFVPPLIEVLNQGDRSSHERDVWEGAPLILTDTT